MISLAGVLVKLARAAWIVRAAGSTKLPEELPSAASPSFTSMFEYSARVAGDRKASDAPMSAFPAAADAMPAPDDELTACRVTCENRAWYAGAQKVNNGAISELPVSGRVRGAEAGTDAAAPASETPEGGLPGLLPQAVRTPAVRTIAAAAVAATARLPARLLPEGGCAFPASNDNVALTRLRPPR